jgi:hypothetical protein
MRCDTLARKLEWLITIAAAIAAPLAVFSTSSAREITEAVGRLGDGTILALAAATHALTVMP